MKKRKRGQATLLKKFFTNKVACPLFFATKDRILEFMPEKGLSIMNMADIIQVGVKKVLAKALVDVLVNGIYRFSSLNNTRPASAGFDLIRAPRRVSYFMGYV